jgi:hypothetical protein
MTIDELRADTVLLKRDWVVLPPDYLQTLDRVLAALPALIDMAEVGQEITHHLAIMWMECEGVDDFREAAARLAALPGPGKEPTDAKSL